MIKNQISFSLVTLELDKDRKAFYHPKWKHIKTIEKVKELLVYNDLTLTEIFYRLGYSSVAHLSNQFKKVTGLTPSHFKELKDKRRKALEQV
jgi:AraC-like DNA-binding protein